jgi:ABC-2 type transport system permease protein
MKQVLAIAGRDFRSIVTSPIYFVIAGICGFIWSLRYLQDLFNFASRMSMAAMQGGGPGGMNINYQLFLQHISYVHLIFIFAVPAVTMRLLSEEKKQRTYDLLLTSPITATQIALGKFLAGYGAVAVLVLISFLYPAGTALVAKFSWSTLLTAYLGVLLVAGFYVSVGVFASSLTDSAMLSVVLGVLFNLTIWFVGVAQESVDSSLWNSVLAYVSIGQQFFNFLKGTLRLSSVVFFLSAISFFVFLCQRVVESARWR